MKYVIKETQDEQDIKTRTAVFQNFKSGDDIGVSLTKKVVVHQVLEKFDRWIN